MSAGSDLSPGGAAGSHLAERVDAVATQLMLDGPTNDAPWLAAELESIGAGARAAGLDAAADRAATLQIVAAGQTSTRWSELTSGLTELQQALLETPAAPLFDAELLGDFVIEAAEHLATIEQQILLLEKDPGNQEAVHSIFRSFHTIKGVAGFLSLSGIQAVAHEVETLLDRLRSGRISFTPDLADVILLAADYLRRTIDCLKAGGEPAAPDALLRQIAATIETGAAAPAAEVQASDVSVPRGRSPEAGSAIKVETAKLDYLVDMVGEMVIAQSLVRHDPALTALRSSRLVRNLSQLARMTGEVQRTAMSMRMIPIGRLFRRVDRLVRDLCRKSGKRVRLEVSGEETELDRTIVEDLADPLLHMVRNAVDHGIESPDARRQAGKPEIGVVTLKAAHQAGNIIIRVADDGRGLNRERILRKARERGLIPASRELAEQEIFNLICEPGFSTAESVSDVSGRGVGMDVVRRRIEQMRGRLQMQSVEGKGSTFTILVPLTLAIIDGLVVGVGGERYIVPIFCVRETLRPAPGVVSTVENSAEVALIRNELLPVFRLARTFGVQGAVESPEAGILIVSEVEGCRFGVLVDELIGKQEVVIKSLGEHLGAIRGISGCAILGDGRVGLILDLAGLYRAGNDAAA
jgi:two-component system chemotaxis sensor kinase CheA